MYEFVFFYNLLHIILEINMLPMLLLYIKKLFKSCVQNIGIPLLTKHEYILY